MNNKNRLYTAVAATSLALATGCTIPPRSADAPRDCPHRSTALEAIVTVGTEPLVWPDQALQGVGANLVTGSNFNDLVTGGYLVREGDDSVYDGHGESVARRIFGVAKTNAAAGLLIYGATSGASSSSSGSGGSGGDFIYEETGGPGIR